MVSKKKIEQETEVKLESGDLIKAKRANDFISLYVNNTQFGYTRFDFQIVFGRVEITRDEDYNYVQEKAVVTMTPEYAKAFLTDFAKVLMEYESKHGVIEVRQDIT